MATALELWAGNLLILFAPAGYRPGVNLCLLDFLAEVWQMPGHERLTYKGRSADVIGHGGVTVTHDL